MKEPKREFTTSTGKVVHLQAVAQRLLTDIDVEVEREFTEKGKPVEPPKYDAPTIGGGSKSFYHDEESIKTATDEEKQLWVEHKKCLSELEDEQGERKLGMFIIEGVLEEPTDEWLARMKHYKMKLPKDPFDLKVRYVTYDLLRTPEDLAIFASAIMLLSAGMEVDEAAIEAAMGSFRDSIRGKIGPLLVKFAEQLVERGGGKLDLQPGVPEGEGGGESGQVDDGVRPDEQD